MHTERFTILMTAAKKARLSERAAARRMSVGQYVRYKMEDEEELTAEQEAELTLLVAQANAAIPKMRDAMDGMIAKLDATHEKVDHALRAAGIRL